MGPRAAGLVRDLYDADLQTFSVVDALRVGGGTEKSIRRTLERLLDAGVINRVKPGLYNIVPFELGNQRDYLGTPSMIAIEIARRRLPQGTPFFASHATAMTIHQMVTQPILTVYVTTPKQLRDVSTMGTEIRFVKTSLKRCFGIEERWLDKNTKIPVSDIERTVLDGLKQPGYSGGLVEVAKGLWIKRNEIDLEKFVAYARKLQIGAVACRLGYLLQLYELADDETLSTIKNMCSLGYSLLDPDMPPEGRHDSAWHLRLNVTPEELKAIVRT
jgi:predicted transcriptional regulator of viral defense system